MDLQFCVNVLRCNKGGKISPELRENLNENATYCKKLNIWLFEGDWDIELAPWIEKDHIENWGEIIVPSLGGLSDLKIAEIVWGQMDTKKRILEEAQHPHPTEDGK